MKFFKIFFFLLVCVCFLSPAFAGKRLKSNTGIMLNLTSRFGDSVSNINHNPAVNAVGEIADSKINVFSANVDVLYGFDFGLVLGATYSSSSSKTSSKNKLLMRDDNYTAKAQLYGPTIGYFHNGDKGPSGLYTLFTYFAGGTCDDSGVTDCSVDNGYQFGLGWAFPIVSTESFTLALGPQISFIETNFSNDKKFELKRQETTPFIALWFMW